MFHFALSGDLGIVHPRELTSQTEGRTTNHETIRKKNHRENVSGHWSVSLPKGKATKANINKWYYMKLKTF